MRRSVFVIVAGLFAIAAALLIFGWRQTQVAATADPADRTVRSITSSTPPARRSDARPAVASVASPRPALDRYLSEDRLFDVFEQLRQSPHGADLWVARHIALDCRLAFREASMITAALTGQAFNHFEWRGPGTRAGAASGEDGSVGVTRVIATPAQMDAARELQRRCDGFESMTLATYRSSLADIDDRLRRVDDAVGVAAAIADHRMPAVPERLRSILASQDRLAITLIDAELGERWQRFSGTPIVRALFGAPTPAMQLVACDLDSDCSPTSRTALFGCLAEADSCGLDMHGQLMRLETPPTQQLIEDTRTAYLHAIASGDYAIWGL